MATDDTIFITGFPGFIAGRLVERLAADGGRFMLLVQPAFVERARAEVARVASQAGAGVDRFNIFEGDITRDRLGMSGGDYETATREATAIFHLAAIYDLGVERDLAQRVNVGGTKNVNAFARAAKKLRRYNYVSTCYVAGRREGLIREDELRHDAGFRNHYEETKYLAEIEVDNLKSELPVTIHRPSVVCGDSRTGETAKYDGVYYLIKYLMMQPRLFSLVNIGNHDVRLNVVPVDFVVESIAALSRDERAAGATVQLADPAPLTTYDLFETVAQTIAQRGSLVAAPPALVQKSLGLKVSEKLSGLPRVGVPYFFLRQTYDTKRAQELLAPHRVACPPFASYVNALIGFVEHHPTL